LCFAIWDINYLIAVPLIKTFTLPGKTTPRRRPNSIPAFTLQKVHFIWNTITSFAGTIFDRIGFEHGENDYRGRASARITLYWKNRKGAGPAGVLYFCLCQPQLIDFDNDGGISKMAGG